MKYALIIPDGCADEPQAVLGGKTPLQAANIPQMDAVAASGIVGCAENVPASLPAGSDVGTMSLFGYDPLRYHTGRAPIEAAAQGLELGPDDWAIRCNLITVQNGVMRSFTAGQVPNNLAAELLGLLQKDQCGDAHWKFQIGVSYRNLLLYRARGMPAPFTAETQSTPPHDITDQPVAAFLPQGPGSAELRQLITRSETLFASNAANRQRAENGRLPVTGIWLWGLGKRPSLPTFYTRFALRGAVITAVDLLRGLGRLLDWQVIEVPGATGYLDTDYAAKGRAAIAALKGNVDLVVVHVEATDEASHEGDAAEKIRALERIDAEIVAPVHAYLKTQGAYRLLVSPDHPTLLRTKTHAHGDVPFAMCGDGILPDDQTAYSEPAAAATGLRFPGYELMPHFLKRTAT